MIFIDLFGIIVFCLAVWLYWPILKWYYKELRRK